jgi:hypothetical protein
MAKIGIAVTNFRRVEVLRIFCAGIKRLRQETGLEIPVVCTGDDSGSEVCREYNIFHVVYPNSPLTDKFNRACAGLYNKVDYVMIMGSDNLMSTKAFLALQAEADKGIDLIGFDTVYFFGMDDIHTGQLIKFHKTTVLGVGRTISKRVLDKLYWEPWTKDRDRAIDTIMLDAVRDYVKTRTLLSDHFIVDLKTSANLNPIHFWAKKIQALPENNLLFENIGEEEARLISAYID